MHLGILSAFLHCQYYDIVRAQPISPMLNNIQLSLARSKFGDVADLLVFACIYYVFYFHSLHLFCIRAPMCNNINMTTNSSTFSLSFCLSPFASLYFSRVVFVGQSVFICLDSQ